MTKEDWEKVEKALSGTYGYATIQVDGRKISFHRVLVSKNRMGIFTYIDGEFKGIWGSAKEEHPEQKFLCKVEKYLWSPKHRAELKKWPKRMLKKYGEDPNKKIHFFSPYWASVTAIRRHYQKTFTSIELIEVVG